MKGNKNQKETFNKLSGLKLELNSCITSSYIYWSDWLQTSQIAVFPFCSLILCLLTLSPLLVNWVFAEGSLHKPSEMLNQYDMVEVISEPQLTSLRVSCTRSHFQKALLQPKSTAGEEGRSNYARPPRTGHRNPFTIICWLSFFGEHVLSISDSGP